MGHSRCEKCQSVIVRSSAVELHGDGVMVGGNGAAAEGMLLPALLPTK